MRIKKNTTIWIHTNGFHSNLHGNHSCCNTKCLWREETLPKIRCRKRANLDLWVVHLLTSEAFDEMYFDFIPRPDHCFRHAQESFFPRVLDRKRVDNDCELWGLVTVCISLGDILHLRWCDGETSSRIAFVRWGYTRSKSRFQVFEVAFASSIPQLDNPRGGGCTFGVLGGRDSRGRLQVAIWGLFRLFQPLDFHLWFKWF